jgi:hypothetical protein
MRRLMRILPLSRIFFFLAAVATQKTVAETPIFYTLRCEDSLGRQSPFLSHQGPGDFDNTLAMNLPYRPVQELRVIVEGITGRPLIFFKGFDPLGEAHVTTLSPVELIVLRQKLSMNEIEEIARAHNIQSSDLQYLGFGSAKKELDGRDEETFFLIVESQNLRRIRQAIYDEFARRSDDPSLAVPPDFYPHITIGYTKRDLHISDGVIKNQIHSLDSRIQLRN